MSKFMMQLGRFLALLVFWIGAVSAHEMRFDILYMNQTNVVVADGEITKDTPERFRKFLDSDPFDGSIYIVALNSPGGNLSAGLELGQLIREEGLNTSIAKYPFDPNVGQLLHIDEPGYCYSACALAFLGGKKRTLDSSSQIGFHQFRRASNSYFSDVEDVWVTQGSSQITSANILDYIVEMGINPMLFSELSKTLPQDMFVPSSDELEAFNIITQSAFRNFGFEPYKEGVIAYSEFPENAIGRNLVGQITTYCKQGEPYILLSLPPDGIRLESSFVTELRDRQDGFTLSSDSETIHYGPEALFFYSGGLPIAEIKLDARGAELLKGKASGSIDIGMVMGWYSFSSEPNLADTRKIDASFRLCIH